MKKVVIFVLLFLMILPIKSIGGDFSDMPNNWSTQALEKAVENGLLNGSNGMIMPNENLTRGQMAAVINRSFGAYKEGSLEGFTDVSASEWYYTEMAKAVNMKTFEGSNNKLNPTNSITREEAFAVMARALKIEPIMEVPSGFVDLDQISDWAKAELYAMIQAGYIQGSNNMVNPKGFVTRAEFAKLMDNIIKQYIITPGEYNTIVEKGNVMVNSKDVVLKDMVIEGDLIIGDGVADGNVTLVNVEVMGRMLVRGGGVDSVKITGTSKIKNIILARVDGKVRVYSEDGAIIGQVIADGSQDVIIEGNFDLVTLLSSDIELLIKDASVKSLVVSGEGCKINVDKDSMVDKVVVNAKNTTIEGKGSVKEVTANANDVLVNTMDTKVTAGENTRGVMAGDIKVEAGKTETVKEYGVVPPNTSNSGGTVHPELLKNAYLTIGSAKPEKAEIRGTNIDIKLPVLTSGDDAENYIIIANFNEPVEKVSAKFVKGSQKINVGLFFEEENDGKDNKNQIKATLDRYIVESYYSSYGKDSMVVVEVVVEVLSDSKQYTYIININN